MATGNYILGATVKIPIQFTLDGIPHSDNTPVVEKIIRPNGTLLPGLPIAANIEDITAAMYSFSFVPTMAGDYIAIIKNTHEGVDYFTHDNFTVTNGIKSAPRAEPK